MKSLFYSKIQVSKISLKTNPRNKYFLANVPNSKEFSTFLLVHSPPDTKDLPQSERVILARITEDPVNIPPKNLLDPSGIPVPRIRHVTPRVFGIFMPLRRMGRLCAYTHNEQPERNS